MSASDAVCPFFMTWVESLTLSCSEIWFFDLSSFSTLPVTCELLRLDELSDDPVPREPEELPDPIDDPELDEPDPREPDEPLDDFEGSEGSVAEEPELPEDPVPIDPEEPDEPVLDEPADPLPPAAPAGNAMSSPATPRPAIIPLLIFMFPSRLVPLSTDQAPARSRRVAPLR